MAYRYTRDPRMLQTAQKVTNYYLDRLPADAVPFWDFDAPASQQVKDSSTAAVVASALLERSEFVTEPADKTRYRDAALRMLETLASPAYLTSGTARRSTSASSPIDVTGAQAVPWNGRGRRGEHLGGIGIPGE